MTPARFYFGSDVFGDDKRPPHEVVKEVERACIMDQERLRAAGDVLPHVVYANPMLTKAKELGVSLTATGRVKPTEPLYAAESAID